MSEDTIVASAEVSEGDLVVTPAADAGAGSATVTVTGRNDEGQVETLTFLITWRAPRLAALVPADSDIRHGFVRVVNRDGRDAEARIVAVDDSGARSPPLTLAVGAGRTVHLNSTDLEQGNPGKGLTGSAGRPAGDWWLEVESAADLDVLPYVRTGDGFLTPMAELAPFVDGVHRVPTFNPASNLAQVSSLRLVNLGDAAATASITGIDDSGRSPGDEVEIDVPAGEAVTFTAAELEDGATDLRGRLGDGQGKWRLEVASSGDLKVMSLLSSPEGHLTNLSTEAAATRADGVHVVPLFPSAADALGRQGFLRVINPTDSPGVVRIDAYDEAGRAYEPLELSLDASKAAHVNSDDLELGNTDKGLSGSTGGGTGDWRLELSSELDIQVFAYVRTSDGFLTAIHGVVPKHGRRYEVATFNPASNLNQRSKLRIVNPGTRPAHVSIAGVDDAGASSGGAAMSIPPHTTRTLTAEQLEGGTWGMRGGIGDGAGKWRLVVDSEQPILVMNLLESPTGHLTNLTGRTNQ